MNTENCGNDFECWEEYFNNLDKIIENSKLEKNSFIDNLKWEQIISDPIVLLGLLGIGALVIIILWEIINFMKIPYSNKRRIRKLEEKIEKLNN